MIKKNVNGNFPSRIGLVGYYPLFNVRAKLTTLLISLPKILDDFSLSTEQSNVATILPFHFSCSEQTL
ncbi:hypothetical protein [Psychromonas sp.]|uniref:hypothetical protein n=1 Tax=Psychromonas sp. TaxID=1884585 RepID=UPI003563E7F3